MKTLFHLIMTLMTGGLWLLVLLIMHLTKKH
jgi:hypothetical protein